MGSRWLACKLMTILTGFESDLISSCQHSPLLPTQETEQFSKEVIKRNKLFPGQILRCHQVSMLRVKWTGDTKL